MQSKHSLIIHAFHLVGFTGFVLLSCEPLVTDFRDIEEAIPAPGAEIVLYCGGGYRSALAALNLQQMGYTNVWSMAGGIRDWRAADYPLETD